jgi:hypothetical protein
VTPAQGRERGRSTTPKGNWLAFQQGETPINPAGAQALTEGTYIFKLVIFLYNCIKFFLVHPDVALNDALPDDGDIFFFKI